MLLVFIRKCEVGQNTLFSKIKKHHVLPPHQISEEPKLSFKSYEENNPLLCANCLETVKKNQFAALTKKLSYSNMFYFCKDSTPQNLCQESIHAEKIHYLDI